MTSINAPMNAANPSGALYGGQTVPTDASMQGPITMSTNEQGNFNKEIFERFGMPQNGNPLANPYGGVRTVYETWPEAFGGAYGRTIRNRHIESIIISQIADSERFIPRFVFPIVLNMDGGTKFDMSELRFHDHLLDRVPELGVPRLLTKSSRQWEVNIARYGLGFFMEHGFAMTDVGKRQYDMSILQIRNAVWETIDRDAYYQLLRASHTKGQIEFFWQHFNSPFGHACTVAKVIDHECQYWGALNRREHAITALIDHAEKMMKRKQVTPEICLVPHGTLEIIGRRPELAEFMRVGEIAVKAQGSPEGNLRIYEQRGIKFHEVNLVTNSVDDSEMPEDPLVRERMVGTFFQMNHPARSIVDYRESYSDIDVHNNDTDQMETLHRVDVETNCAFSEEILRALLRKAYGPNTPDAQLSRVTWNAYFKRLQNERKVWAGFPQAGQDDQGNPVDLEVPNADGASGAGYNGKHVLDTSDAEVRDILAGLRLRNLMAPFNYLICRPFERWTMGSMIFTQGGGKAGFTAIGQQDFQLGHNPVSKYLEGTYTLNMGVVLTNPDAVFVFHNVRYGEYRGGGGCEYFDPQHPDILPEKLSDRSGCETSPSLLVVPYHVNERINKAHIDLTGYFTLAEQRNERGAENQHFSTAVAAAEYWKLDPTPEAYLFDTTYHDGEGRRPLGTRMSQGHQLMYAAGVASPDAVPQRAAIQMIGRGHHGPYTYPGVAADRMGTGGRRYVAVSTIYDKVPMYMHN